MPVNSRRIRVLVVDDEPSIHRFLAPALAAAGYEPLRADTGQQGLAEIACHPPDVVILDLGLPDIDGQDVLRQAHEFYRGPILILSARDREIEKIEALDTGAEDFIEKPFNVGELLARIRAALRRQRVQTQRPRLVTAGALTLDFDRRLVTRAGEIVRLSPKEYDLLVKLAEAEGKVLSHNQLLASVWGPHHTQNTHYLRVFIGQIRQKIEVDPAHPQVIQTQQSIGYRFVGDGVVR